MASSSEPQQNARRSPSRSAPAGEPRGAVRPSLALPVVWSKERSLEKAETDSGGISSAEEKTGRASVGGSTATSDTSCFVSGSTFPYSAGDDGGDTASPQSVVSQVEARAVETAQATQVAEQLCIEVRNREASSSQRFFSWMRKGNEAGQCFCDRRESDAEEETAERPGEVGVKQRSSSGEQRKKGRGCGESFCASHMPLLTRELLPHQPSAAYMPQSRSGQGTGKPHYATQQTGGIEAEVLAGRLGSDVVRRGQGADSITFFLGSTLVECPDAAPRENGSECDHPAESKFPRLGQETLTEANDAGDGEAYKGPAEEMGDSPAAFGRASSLAAFSTAPSATRACNAEQLTKPAGDEGSSVTLTSGTYLRFPLSLPAVAQQPATNPCAGRLSRAEGEGEAAVSFLPARGCKEAEVEKAYTMAGTNGPLSFRSSGQGNCSWAWGRGEQRPLRSSSEVFSCGGGSAARVRPRGCTYFRRNCTISPRFGEDGRHAHALKTRSRSLQSDYRCSFPGRVCRAEEHPSILSSRSLPPGSDAHWGRPPFAPPWRRSDRRSSSVFEKRSGVGEEDAGAEDGENSNETTLGAFAPVWFPTRSPRKTPVALPPSPLSLCTVENLAQTTGGGRASRDNRAAKDCYMLDESPSSGNTNAGMSGPTTRTSGSLERYSSQASQSAAATDGETGCHSGETVVTRRRRWASFDVMDSDFDFDRSNEDDEEQRTRAEPPGTQHGLRDASSSRASRFLTHLLEKKSIGPRSRPGNGCGRGRGFEQLPFTARGDGSGKRNAGLSSLRRLMDIPHRSSDTRDGGVHRSTCMAEKTVFGGDGPSSGGRRHEVEEVGAAGWTAGLKKFKRRQGYGGAGKRSLESLQHPKTSSGSLPSLHLRNQNRFSALSSTEETSPSSALSSATGTKGGTSRSREVSVWESGQHAASAQEKRIRNGREDPVPAYAGLARKDENRAPPGSGLLVAPLSCLEGYGSRGAAGSSHGHQIASHQERGAGLLNPVSAGQSRSALLGAFPVPALEACCDSRCRERSALPLSVPFEGFELFCNPLTVQLLGSSCHGVAEGMRFVEEQQVEDREKRTSAVPGEKEVPSCLVNTVQRTVSAGEQAEEAQDTGKPAGERARAEGKDDPTSEVTDAEERRDQQTEANDQGWVVARRRRKPVTDLRKRQQDMETRQGVKNKRLDLAFRSVEWVAWLDPCGSAAKSSVSTRASLAGPQPFSSSASMSHVNSAKCACVENFKGENGGGKPPAAPGQDPVKKESKCAACCALRREEGVSFERRLQEEYEKGLQKIARLSSWRAVAPFLAWWLPATTTKALYNLCLFKSPVKPLWEHSDNIGGGHFALRRFPSRATAQEMFRVLASVVLREDALPCVAHHCNGVVYCARQHWRKLKIEFWTATVENAVLAQQEALLRRLLGQLPAGGSDVEVSFFLHTAVVHKNQQKLLRAARSKGRLAVSEGGVLRVPSGEGVTPPPPTLSRRGGAAIRETAHSAGLASAPVSPPLLGPDRRAYDVLLSASSEMTAAQVSGKVAVFDKVEPAQQSSAATVSCRAPNTSLRRSASADPRGSCRFSSSIIVPEAKGRNTSRGRVETASSVREEERLGGFRLQDTSPGPHHEVWCLGCLNDLRSSVPESERGPRNKLGSRSLSCMGRLLGQVWTGTHEESLSRCLTSTDRSPPRSVDAFHMNSGDKCPRKTNSIAVGLAADSVKSSGHAGGTRTGRTSVHPQWSHCSASRGGAVTWEGGGSQEKNEEYASNFAARVQGGSPRPSAPMECVRRPWPATKSPPSGTEVGLAATGVGENESEGEMQRACAGEGEREALGVPLRKNEDANQPLSQRNRFDFQGVEIDKSASLLPPPRTCGAVASNFASSSPLLRPGHFLRPIPSAGFPHGSRRGAGAAPVYPVGWARGGARYGRGVLQRGEEEGMHRRQAPGIFWYRGGGGAGLAGSSRGGSFSRGVGRANGTFSGAAAGKGESLLGSRQCSQPRPALLGGQEAIRGTRSPTLPAARSNSWWGGNGTVMRYGLATDEQRQKLINQISRVDVKSIPDYFTMQLSANLGTAGRGVCNTTVSTGAVLTPGSAPAQSATTGLVSALAFSCGTAGVPGAGSGHAGETTCPQQAQPEHQKGGSWPANSSGLTTSGSCPGGTHVLSPSVGIAVARLLQAQQPPVSPLMHAVQQQLGLQVGSPQPSLLPPAFSLLASGPTPPQEFMLPPLAQSFEISDLFKGVEAPPCEAAMQEVGGYPFLHKEYSMESSEVQTIPVDALPVQAPESGESHRGAGGLARVENGVEHVALRPFTFNPQASVFQPAWAASARHSDIHDAGVTLQEEVLAEVESNKRI